VIRRILDRVAVGALERLLGTLVVAVDRLEGRRRTDAVIVSVRVPTMSTATSGRASEPSWQQIGVSRDPSGRRQLWARLHQDWHTLELCAGREGDDAYVRLLEADMSPSRWAEFLNVIMQAMWADEQTELEPRPRPPAR
jgi:hypothetical protein